MSETETTRLDFATAGGVDAICSRYHSVITALYNDSDTAHIVAKQLVASGVPDADISVVLSEGKLRESLDRGVCLIPPAEFRGIRHHGAVGGAMWGGLSGLVLGSEIVVLGAGAVFALPVLAGAVLIGVAVGATMNATFSQMDVALEGTGYRIHLQHGGALLAVYAASATAESDVDKLLRETHPTEMSRHPLARAHDTL